jgi:hypothetical protein
LLHRAEAAESLVDFQAYVSSIMDGFAGLSAGTLLQDRGASSKSSFVAMDLDVVDLEPLLERPLTLRGTHEGQSLVLLPGKRILRQASPKAPATV